MKRRMLIGALAVLAAGCTETTTDNITLPADDAQNRSITLTAGGSTGTRATWSDELRFEWEQSDVLGYVTDSETAKGGFASTGLTLGEAKSHGDFAIEIPADASTLYAWYPYSDGAAEASEGGYKIGFEVAASQSTEAGKVSLKNGFIVSKEAVSLDGDSASTELKLATPVVKFLVYDTSGAHSGETVKSISITVDEASAIAGKAAYTVDFAGTGKFEDAAAGSNEITAKVSGEATIAGSRLDAEGLYIAVLPAEASEVTYTVVTDEATYTFHKDGEGQTFAENTIYTLPLNIPNADKGEAPEPEPEVVPAITSIAAADGGKFYLNTAGVIKGTDLDAVTAVSIGQTTLTIDSQSATEIKFSFPAEDGADAALEFENEEADEFTVTLAYGEDQTLDATDKITIYPFYYYKDVVLGIGSNGNKTYTKFGHDNAFFMPDTGEVLSATEWKTTAVDKWFLTEGGNPYIESSSILSATATDEIYYGVKPYLYFYASSSELCLPNSSSSDSKVNRHYEYANDEYVALAKTFGTPVIIFSIITNQNPALAETIKSGEVTSIQYTGSFGSSEPKLAVTEANNKFVEGSVIGVGYSTTSGAKKPFEQGKTSKSLGSAEDVAKIGYLYIKEITCVEPGTITLKEVRDGYIKFDFYWSKWLNK